MCFPVEDASPFLFLCYIYSMMKKIRNITLIATLSLFILACIFYPVYIILPSFIGKPIEAQDNLWNIFNNVQQFLAMYKSGNEIAVGYFYAMLAIVGTYVFFSITNILFDNFGHNTPKSISKVDEKIAKGSQHWMTPKERDEIYRKVSKDAPIFNAKVKYSSDIGGIPVCTEGDTAWLSPPQEHILVLGTTGSGKTRRVIFPSIWTLGYNKQSMIISDLKGELYTYSSNYLKEQGYDVYVLNFLNPAISSHWNPFTTIDRLIKEGDYDEAIKHIDEIADGIISISKAEGSSSDPFWDNSAKTFITSILCGMCFDPELDVKAKTFANFIHIVQELFERMQPATRAGSVSQEDPVLEWLKHVEEQYTPKQNFSVKYMTIYNARNSPPTFGSILATVSTKIDPLTALTPLTIITSQNDIDFRKFGEKPSVLYLVIPYEISSYDFFVSLLVNFSFFELVQAARLHESPTPGSSAQLPVPVWYVLDEFGNLPPIPDMTRKISVSRSQGIHFLIVLQDFAQLDKNYDEKVASNIRSNLRTTIILNAVNPQTQKAVSEMIGHTTINTRSVSKSKQDSESISLDTRELMKPEEVGRIHPPQAVVVGMGRQPMLATLDDMSKWKELTRRFVPVESNIFIRTTEIQQKEKILASSIPYILPPYFSSSKEEDALVSLPFQRDNKRNKQTRKPSFPAEEIRNMLSAEVNSDDKDKESENKEQAFQVPPPNVNKVIITLDKKMFRLNEKDLKQLTNNIEDILPLEKETEEQYIIRVIKELTEAT